MKDAQPSQDIEQLRYRSALFEAQNEATPDGILVVDTNGKMIYYNQRFVEMWKIPTKIMHNKDDTAALRFGMTRLINPQQFIERVEYLYANPDEVSHEEINFKDGQVLDRYGVPVASENGHKYGWAWYFRDITESKKYEKAILRQNEYLKALQETAIALGKRLEILPLLDTILEHAARIASTSDGYIYLLDETKTKLVVKVGNGIFKDYLGFELAKGEGMAGKVWKSGKMLSVDDYDSWSGRSKAFPVSVLNAVVAIPLLSGKNFVGVIAIAYTNPSRKFQPEEITALEHLAELASIALENARLYKQAQHETLERKQAEAISETLTEQRARLLEINRTKDEFISLASHQLRTPATGVKQYLGMVLEGYCGDLTGKQKQMIQTAHDSNERQLHIVNDLLNVAQADAGKITLNKRPIDLISMVNDIIKEQADTFKGRFQVITCKNEILIKHIMADEDRLRMVLENIIDNAGKYSPKGSKVAVTIKQTESNVTIQVKDKGVGISPSDHSKLFKKFSRIDNPLSSSVSGSGLGLYWAQQIIALHEGSIKVASKLSQGSSFTISLPLKNKAD